MKSKWLIIILFLSLAINVGVLATTGYHYCRNLPLTPSAPCPVSPGDEHLYQSLGLSGLQLSRMEPLAQIFHDRLAELGSRMEQKKARLVDLLQKNDDPATMEGLRKEMASIQDEIQKEVIVHVIETKKILDPGQQQKFFDLMRQSMTRAQSPWSAPAYRQAGTEGGQ
jgi:Spy/CpxP family protein refolding chaperone